MSKNTPAPDPNLTVEQLRDALDKMVQAGMGGKELQIPYSPAVTRLRGRTPSVGVLGAYSGIDWDTGSVFLRPTQQLGEIDQEVRQKMRQLESDWGKILIMVDRLGRSDQIFPLEQQIEELKQFVRAPSPKAPKQKR